MKPHMLPPTTVPPDWRHRLRSFVPDEAVTFTEAQRIAARQARYLRAWLGGLEPLTVQTLTQMPGLTRHSAPLTVSGTPLSSHSSYQRGGWHIHTDSTLPAWMSRWAIAHEIKHILDASLLAEQTTLLTLQQREELCDRFAACLLMPTSAELMQWRQQGQPCYPIPRLSDTITPSDPEVSKDDLAPIGDSG